MDLPQSAQGPSHLSILASLFLLLIQRKICVLKGTTCAICFFTCKLKFLWQSPFHQSPSPWSIQLGFCLVYLGILPTWCCCRAEEALSEKACEKWMVYAVLFLSQSKLLLPENKRPLRKRFMQQVWIVSDVIHHIISVQLPQSRHQWDLWLFWLWALAQEETESSSDEAGTTLLTPSLNPMIASKCFLEWGPAAEHLFCMDSFCHFQ